MSGFIPEPEPGRMPHPFPWPVSAGNSVFSFNRSTAKERVSFMRLDYCLISPLTMLFNPTMTSEYAWRAFTAFLVA